jgi:hypothetical protein
MMRDAAGGDDAGDEDAGAGNDAGKPCNAGQT